MDCPEMYVKENGMQRRDAQEIVSLFVEKLTWQPNEIVMDVGCGPGDVTSTILYPLLKDKILHLIGVDKSAEMVEYASKKYKCESMDFKVLDIEDVGDCTKFKDCFDKIFSFFCFHWVHKKVDAVFNMYSMLKSGGEIIVNFLLINPLVEMYKKLDDEWKHDVKDLQLMSQDAVNYDEVISLFTTAGFRLVSIDTNVKKYTFPDLASVLSATKSLDEMYSILPPHLHEEYSEHVKDIIVSKNMVTVCPTTGETTSVYYPITIHCVKD